MAMNICVCDFMKRPKFCERCGKEVIPPTAWINMAARELFEVNSDRGKSYDNSPTEKETAKIIERWWREHGGGR